MIDLVDDGDDSEPDEASRATAAAARGEWVPALPPLAVKDEVPRRASAPPPPPRHQARQPLSPRGRRHSLRRAAARTSRATCLSRPSVARLAAVLAATVVEEEASGALNAPVAKMADRLRRDHPRTVAGGTSRRGFTAVWAWLPLRRQRPPRRGEGGGAEVGRRGGTAASVAAATAAAVGAQLPPPQRMGTRVDPANWLLPRGERRSHTHAPRGRCCWRLVGAASWGEGVGGAA